MRHLEVCLLAGSLALQGAPAAASTVSLPDEPAEIANWTAPPYWVDAHAAERRALASGPMALPFISVFPCRLVDTRGNAPLTGGFLPSATVRSYTLTGVCNIPASAQAISLNVTVVHPTGPGFLTIYPEGGAFPPVSTLNYLGNDVIVNAAVVPLSATGGISIALGVSGGDVILDTNGYYAASGIVTSLSGLTGNVTLAAGPNVTIASLGGTLTINAPLSTLDAGSVKTGVLGLGFGGTGSANPFQSFQARVSGTCGPGNAIATINQDGTVGCASTRDARPGFARTTLENGAGQYPSIAIGVDGLALISYRFAAGGGLMVGHCGDAACTSITGTVLDPGNVGFFTSLAIGADGLGLIGYQDAGNGVLKIAHCDDVPCTTATVSTPKAGKPPAAIHASYTSITIGTDGLGLISVYDPVALSLRTVHCINAACSTASAATLDSTSGVGSFNTIAIGSDGLGLIAYPFFNALGTAHCADVACTSATISENPAYGPFYVSITIGADGLGLISGSSGPGILGVAHCTNVACTSFTGLTVLDPIHGGSATSITTGPDGLGLIAYRDNVNGGLRIAHCSNAACSVAATSAVDPIGGDDASITMGSDGLGIISHYDFAGQNLHVVHCANALCTPFVRRR